MNNVLIQLDPQQILIRSKIINKLANVQTNQLIITLTDNGNNKLEQ